MVWVGVVGGAERVTRNGSWLVSVPPSFICNVMSYPVVRLWSCSIR